MELIAQKRETLGKKTKKLREERKIPAVIFGKGIESIPITIEYNPFVKVYKEVGETSLIDVKFNGSTEKVLIGNVQYHPVTSQILHVDLHKVDLTAKITASIPVAVVGDEENDLVKSGQAMVLVLQNEIDVEAYPTDLPSEFTVDISGLAEVGAGITVGELSYDREKVEIADLEADEIVVKLDYAEMQEVEEEEEVSEEELIEGMEATEETAAEEGEGEESEKPAAEASEATE